MKRYIIPLAVLILLVGFSVWWYSPTQVIKRKVSSLLSTLTLEASDGRAGRNFRGYAFHDLLAPEIELTTPTIEEANGTFDRDELDSAFSWLCNQAKQTRFEMEDLHEITIDGDKATVKLTLTGLVELPTYRPADGTYDVTFDWEKSKDGWQLTRAVWDKVP